VKSLKDEIAKDAINRFYHDSGMLSHPNSSRIDNDNPILQLGVFTELYGEGEYKEALHNWEMGAVEKTRIGYGLWKRSTEHTSLKNSHDNIVAIARVDPAIAKEIVETGKLTNWQFNGDPLQPGDWAVVKVFAHEDPEKLEMLWCLIGVILLCFKPLNFQFHLTWLRVHSMVRKAFQFQSNLWTKAFVILAYLIYTITMVVRYQNSLWGVFKYYDDPEQPSKRLAAS